MSEMKVLAILVAVAVTTSAQADVTISSKPTQNMNCSGGVCSPTAPKAVLNATDLANMLAGSDVNVTTGSGATNIVVKDSVGWTSTSRLTLDAIQSVEIDKPVSVVGTGALTITTNDGGTGGDLTFDGKGNVTFWDLASSLVIDGNSYTLVGDIASLASDIANNLSGFYALANDYDASVDGTYSAPPIAAELDGTFEGLNHKIKNLKIEASNSNLGFFAIARGTIRDIGITNASISGDTDNAGMLLASGYNVTIVNCFASGQINLSGTSEGGGLVSGAGGVIDHSQADVAVNISGSAPGGAGGLVGETTSIVISRSYATGKVSAGDDSYVGGLVGLLGAALPGSITESYAMGAVVAGENSSVGGLAGLNGSGSTISDAYAIGAVKGKATGNVGGLVGWNIAAIQSSYSTGQVNGGKFAGGFEGDGGIELSTDYWDTDTTGKSKRQGCGGGRCGRGAKGLTTEEFQSGLPNGFDPAIWGQKKNINNGFPYLLAMPPQ